VLAAVAPLLWLSVRMAGLGVLPPLLLVAVVAAACPVAATPAVILLCTAHCLLTSRTRSSVASAKVDCTNTGTCKHDMCTNNKCKPGM
jgi:hypothetical protein